MKNIVLTNARLIVGDDIVLGSLQLEGEHIADVQPGLSQLPGAVDCGGDYIAPGLVELHTDNLERHLQPRPGVNYPHHAALLAHDRELAGAGITTVFDALRIGSMNGDDTKYKRYARECAHELNSLGRHQRFKISHYLHLRAEVCSDSLIEEMAEFNADDRIGIVSLMDHTPGQRQFRDASKLADYLRGKFGMSEAQIEAHFTDLQALQQRVGAQHEAATVDFARSMGATLASHDDTTAGDVQRSSGFGVKLAEFPTTREAALACRAAGVPVMMGAPNLVRGGSHSGNVSAMDLMHDDLLDIISSDYIPAALLFSAVKVGLVLDNLAQGLAMVTRAPAAAVGLSDRGVLAAGKRADLVRFALDGDTPLVNQVWSKGQRVA